MNKNPLVRFVVDTIYNGLEFFGKYYSEYRAYVIDNEDPDGEGRLQLIVPGIIDQPSDYWAPSSGTFAGQGYGIHFIPPKNSIVWVTFENGNPAFPVWKHGYFGKGEIPTEKKDVNNFWIATPKGHSIELDDTNNIIKITHLKGDVVILTDKGISLESKNIFLGTTDKGKEPGVMGDTLQKVLEDLNKEIGNFIQETRRITTNTNNTISQLAQPSDVANPYTAALATNMITRGQTLNTQIIQSLQKLETINKSISTITERLPNIKSKVVRLDYD